MAELLADWTDAHGGADADPRTLCRLERMAVLDSRPGKEPVGDAEALRASWRQRAAAAGCDALELRAGQARLRGTVSIDRETIIAGAIDQAAAGSSTWLAADLAREIATLVPAGASASAAELVALVVELTAEAAGSVWSFTRLRQRVRRAGATAVPSPSTWSTASSPPQRSGARKCGCWPGREQQRPVAY